MKRIILAVLAVGVLTGLGFYVNRPKPQPVATETPSAAPTVDEAQAQVPGAAPAEPAPLPHRAPASPNVPEPSPPRVPAGPSPALDAALVSQAVDVLVSPQASYQQKRDAWKQLRESGKLDLAISELEQRTANDPRSAELPAALGHAYLQKCATIQDLREQGILAMQADKLFDTALTLDPSNWEARFTKAVAMSYWPPNLNKGDEVIQHFQTLIQQQEAQNPQPQFAETYAWLGDQYQKTGHRTEALATWQRGLSLFPADEKLQGKLAAQ
jgi:tetratricopeptide (TPR) repeat protein